MIDLVDRNNEPETDCASSPNGILILFDGEPRPSCEDVRRAVASIANTSISHDPALAHDEAELDREVETNANGTQDDRPRGEKDAWLELIVNGLTFDLLGLAPGPSLLVPTAIHRYAVEAGSADSPHEAIGLATGPHLSGAESAMPVVRTMVGLARDLAEKVPGASGVYWHPARSHIGLEYFTRITNDWLNGGAFPALGLTSFARSDRGELLSEGLAFFTGQELRLDAAIAQDITAATRLAIRLVHQLVGHGELTSTERVTAPDGSSLTLTPTGNGALVHVTAR